jgi:rhodanese-related sulfurtransferase
MTTPVTATAAADPAAALAHFSARLQFETDAADVAVGLSTGRPGFVLIDARSPEAYEAGHLPGALNLRRPFDPDELAALPQGPVVVYCWGPGCNAADRAAVELAAAGRQVKAMLGGFEYWVREGHPVEGREAEIIAGGVDGQGLVKLRDEISCLC